MDQKAVVHLHDRIIAAERKEHLPFTTAWMELENIMLSEISQALENKYHIISLVTGT